MDADTLRKLEQVFKDVDPIVRASHEPKDVYYLRQPDGSLTRVQAEAEPLEPVFFTTDSLISWLEPFDNEASFYVSSLAITGKFLKSKRILEARMMLPKHPAYQLLEHHLITRAYTQKELIKLLRSKLAGFVDEATIALFRNIKLSASSEGSSVVDQGAEMMGKSVNKAIEGKAGKLPDEIMVMCPVFDTPETRDIKLPVRILVDIVPTDDGVKFELTTVHNYHADALNIALEGLMASVKERTQHPVYYASV